VTTGSHANKKGETPCHPPQENAQPRGSAKPSRITCATKADELPEVEQSKEIPDWVNDTPDEFTYDMSMWDPGGTTEENIDISRDEYIALKSHLAALRQYKIAGVGDRLRAMVRKFEEKDTEALQLWLGWACEIYRHAPEAIVSDAGIEAAFKGLSEGKVE
jgi:hypothetical protein